MEKQSELLGMTVNERLFAIGHLDDFYLASERQDESTMRSILNQIYLTSENVEAIIMTEKLKSQE